MQSDNQVAQIAQFFEPQSVAIVGSFRKGMFGGYVAVKNMMDAGFGGEVFPINPSYKEVLGMKVYPSVLDVPGDIDLALIMIGSRSVPGVLRQCAGKNIKAVVVVADGFAERDEEGVRLQEEVVSIARGAGMRVIGPNTAGIVNTANGLNPCPYIAGYSRIREGGMALCSQTGMINPQAFPYADLGYGMSKICDLGNKCDVDECDMLEYLEDDQATAVISIYMETVRNGHRFTEVAGKVAAKKPVLIFKSGKTREGAKASASHTGSMAVDDKIFDAACKQSGVIRLEKFSELFDLPKIFAFQPLPKGNRLAIVSITGGVGVISTDEGAKYGLKVRPLSNETTEILNRLFPGLGGNPIDMGPSVASVSDFMSFYRNVIRTVAADNQTDCFMNIVWADPAGENTFGYLKIYEDELRNLKKPIATWIYGTQVSVIRDLTKQLEDIEFPVFTELETAIKALGIAYQYSTRQGG